MVGKTLYTSIVSSGTSEVLAKIAKDYDHIRGRYYLPSSETAQSVDQETA